MIWFTSDQHYNHANIITYCKRPFKSVEEMNETLIENHNLVVAPRDEVWHLGDFAWSDAEKFLARLNGQHKLVVGNHDHTHLKPWQFDCFDRVEDVMMLGWEHQKVWLSHYAHARWPSRHKGRGHLFGHSHGMFEGIGRSFDVGVDAQSFAPISIDAALHVLYSIPDKVEEELDEKNRNIKYDH